MYKNDSRHIKVKVYHTLKGDSTARLATFSVTAAVDGESLYVPVALRECMMAVCTSSPDIICQEHDLSIYVANYRESCQAFADKPSNFVWEGHGLLSWLMEGTNDVIVLGRASDHMNAEIHLELQPTLKWSKNTFYSALKTSNFDCFKDTPRHACTCSFSSHLHTTTRQALPADMPTQASTRLLPPPTTHRPEPTLPSLDAAFPRPLLSPPSSADFSLTPSDRRSAFTHTMPTNESMFPAISAPKNKKRKKSPSPSIERPRQINTAVRTFYEVERYEDGRYILPVEIDSWTIVDLGTVVWDRSAYHNQRYIYPVNYTVRKWYRSMVDPKSDTQYTCRILDNGKEPKFEVTADDCPETYSGPTPTTVWTIIVRRAFAIRNQEYGHNPVGPDFFGLRKSTIAKMIQDLPNADKCLHYVWQTFEPAKFNKPGRNRRRIDPTLPSTLLGGVNYSLTSSRLPSITRKENPPTSPTSPELPALQAPTIKTV